MNSFIDVVSYVYVHLNDKLCDFPVTRKEVYLVYLLYTKYIYYRIFPEIEQMKKKKRKG